MSHDTPNTNGHSPAAPDLARIRGRLASLKGRHYWKSLEEAAQSPEFEQMLHREFPDQASEWADPLGRRRFLHLMGASLGLAGLSACTVQPRETIVPQARMPEYQIPGKPKYFATAVTLGGYATGVLAESHMGRPTKLEGNPQHPASRGALDPISQAEILTLYDPDRAQVVTTKGQISSWTAFVAALSVEIEKQKLSGGAGLRVLTGTVTSPALAARIEALLAAFPGAKWHQYEPAGRDAARAGAQLAFGAPLNTFYRLDRAAVILSLDSNFLCEGPGNLAYARDFAAGRRRGAEGGEMNRLYAVESTPTPTGGMADHRRRMRAGEVEALTVALAQAVGVDVAGMALPELSEPLRNWIAAVARDLQAHRGAALVVPGEQQTPVVHALAHAINAALGALGETAIVTEPIEARSVDGVESLRELVDDMNTGRAELLLIVGGNPVYDAPADFGFAEALEKVAFRARLGIHENETSRLCQWNVPEAHALESWGDARAYDGAVSIIQPLIEPLYEGRTALQFLSVALDEPEARAYDLLRAYWQPRMAAVNFEQAWRKALHDGLIEGSAAAPSTATPRADFAAVVSNARKIAASGGQGSLELQFRPDASVWDGRHANNGWLQELPRPMTRLTWDNAALVSPATAERLGLANEDVVTLTQGGRSVDAPVWIVPGQGDDSVTIHLGFGREYSGRVGRGVGFNAYTVRTSGDPWFAAGLEISKTGRKAGLACVQDHSSMEGRELVRVANLDEYRADPEIVHEGHHEPGPELSLFPQHEYKGYAWGMAIDLNSCTGCNACMIGCQSENNVPIVGKEQVRNGREMHWIRIDRYFEGSLDDPETYHEPVMCVHCENAPCEIVCPVGATVHSDEGLNDMVYNRCIGTRYCSNNCPYKVRRFNFLQFADYSTPSLKLLNNPDVTVRTRGVMEKCTYCVQRINSARIDSGKEGRKIRDGEITTACQSACPTEAIVFGDINDPESRVSKLKAGHRNYGLLADLNTRPRTSYLARLRNPNPELEREVANV